MYRALPSHIDFHKAVESPWDYHPSDAHSVVTVQLRNLMDSALPPGALPPDEEAVRAHLIDFLVARVLDKKDTVVLIDGEPGDGKSALGRELVLGVRNALNAVLDLDTPFVLEQDIPYRLSHFIHRIWQSSVEVPLVVMGDEAELIGAQARAGTDEKGALLDRVLSTCRIKACTAFMLAPNIRGISSALRARRAKLWLHVEYRSLATLFELTKAIDFKRPGPLPFVKARAPFHRISWANPEGEEGWTQYEHWKLENADRFLVRAIYKAIELERKEGFPDPPWLPKLPKPERMKVADSRKYTKEYKEAGRIRAAQSYARKKLLAKKSRSTGRHRSRARTRVRD